jgi:hypothetical protein
MIQIILRMSLFAALLCIALRSDADLLVLHYPEFLRQLEAEGQDALVDELEGMVNGAADYLIVPTGSGRSSRFAEACVRLDPSDKSSYFIVTAGGSSGLRGVTRRSDRLGVLERLRPWLAWEVLAATVREDAVLLDGEDLRNLRRLLLLNHTQSTEAQALWDFRRKIASTKTREWVFGGDPSSRLLLFTNLRHAGRVDVYSLSLCELGEGLLYHAYSDERASVLSLLAVLRANSVPISLSIPGLPSSVDSLDMISDLRLEVVSSSRQSYLSFNEVVFASNGVHVSGHFPRELLNFDKLRIHIVGGSYYFALPAEYRLVREYELSIEEENWRLPEQGISVEARLVQIPGAVGQASLPLLRFEVCSDPRLEKPFARFMRRATARENRMELMKALAARPGQSLREVDHADFGKAFGLLNTEGEAFTKHLHEFSDACFRLARGVETVADILGLPIQVTVIVGVQSENRRGWRRGEAVARYVADFIKYHMLPTHSDVEVIAAARRAGNCGHDQSIEVIVTPLPLDYRFGVSLSSPVEGRSR